MRDKENSGILHRKPGFRFDQKTERFWLGESPFKTHLLNSFTLIFPSGEKFFIRSIRACFDKIQDVKISKDAVDFIKQETQHAIEHQKFFKVLIEHGYDPDQIHKFADRLINKILEPLHSKKLNLALTAGLEHLTALFAEISLTSDFLKDAPDELRKLYDWHAAEEIEHRNVAFDVYDQAGGDYFLRIAAFFYGNLVLIALSSGITAYLLHKDKELLKLSTVRDAANVFVLQEKLLIKGAIIFFKYLSPDFHPSKSEIDSLSTRIFEREAFASI